MSESAELVKSQPTFVLQYPDKPGKGEPLVLKIGIYWSKHRIEDQAPGRAPIADDVERETVGWDDHLEEGIHLWDSVTIEVVDHETRGWRTIRGAKAKESYQFWMSYALTFDGPNVLFAHAFPSDEEVPYGCKFKFLLLHAHC